MKDINKKTFSTTLLTAAVVFIAFAIMPAFAQFTFPKLPKPKPTADPTEKTSGGGTMSGGGGDRIPGFYDFAATAPVFDATSVTFNIFNTVSDYSRGTEGQTQTWAPFPSFTVYGPFESGSVINVAFTLPGGAAWFDSDCASLGKVGPGLPIRVECSRDKIPEKKTTALTGVFGFTVTLRNELAGTSSVLYKGTMKAGNWVNNPTNQAKFSKNFLYYPVLDWKLPLAMIFATQAKDQYDTNYPLKVVMWFRGRIAPTSAKVIIGHLFYNGKEVAATDAVGDNNVTDVFSDSGFDESENDYYGRLFSFNAWVYEKDGGSMFFPIHKNPGEYEIKVLQNGKLARSVKFTVGANGMIVDNGYGLKVGSRKFLLPAQVIGDQDGNWNRAALKSEGVFGTILDGFPTP